MITLDSINDQIEPVGFMHIDVEGWESKVLQGANAIINNNNTVIITECWDSSTSTRLGFNENPATLPFRKSLPMARWGGEWIVSVRHL